MDGEETQDVLRIGLLGPGRTRQGLGPYLARFAEEAGGRVVAVAGRTLDRARSAARPLAEDLGHDVRAFATVEELVAEEALDALFVASPIDSHERAVELAVRGGLHVLCEKPFLWGGAEPAARARRLVHDAHARALHLCVNTQWPFTLPQYDELHPGVREAAAETFEFLLAPISTGWAKVPDALPHALSVLQASTRSGRNEDDARIVDPRYVLHDEMGARMSVYFRFDGADRGLDAYVELLAGDAVPRPAAYAFDGYWAKREISMPEYSMSFVAGKRRISYPDPTRALVHDFVRRVQSGPPEAPAHAAVQRVAMLEDLEHAWNEQFGRATQRTALREGDSR